MTIAKIAYLTSPAPNKFILHFQDFGSGEMVEWEISRAHLANIVIDGASMSLREQYPHRVPSHKETENVDGHDRRQQPA